MSSSPTPLRLAGIGCGPRTRTYLSLASKQPQRYQIVGATDLKPHRVEQLHALCGKPEPFLRFDSAEALLAVERFADVVVIGTQDADHVGPCLKAMERGYDVLLEKPAGVNAREVLRLEEASRQLGRKVMICHVLRYTPFYRQVKAIVDSGVLGDIVSVHATEGVGPWHQAHSFVRGHWADTTKAAPMIIAKCCHDLDILCWLLNRPCESVSSVGGLHYFTQANAPVGATARCTDGCPEVGRCFYDAHRYLDEHRGWLKQVYDHTDTAGDDVILAWLRESPWGRCVYQADNNAVDRQIVQMNFSGGVLAELTMTAFDHGRSIEIRGTHGVLRGGDPYKRAAGHDIAVELFRGGLTHYDLAVPHGGYAGHGGGDSGLVHALYDEMRQPDPAAMTSSLPVSVASHLIGFAAEQSRLTGHPIQLDAFRQSQLALRTTGDGRPYPHNGSLR